MKELPPEVVVEILSWLPIKPLIRFRISSLVNGVIHWIAQRPDGSSSRIIAGFDLRDEVFREIVPPSDMNLDDDRNFADIREMGGLLCIFSQSGSFLEIWMMKEYGVFDSWTKLLKFDKCETGFLGETGFIGALRPMGFAQNGDVILMWKQQTLYLCNPETKAARILAQFDDQISNPYAYVGSIISTKFISRAGLSLEEEETRGEKEKDHCYISKLNDQYINMEL